MRVREKVRANLRSPVDRDKAVQHCVLVDLRVFVHKAVGADMGAFADLRAPSNHRRGVNSRSIGWGLVEKLDRSRKIEIGVFTAERGDRGRTGRSLQGDARLK